MGKQLFPETLFKMVTNSDYRDVIRFGDDGRTIIINKSNSARMEAVLTSVFKHSTYQSLQRQFGNYDFKSQAAGTGVVHVTHPKFRADSTIEEIQSIHRLAPKNVARVTRTELPQPVVPTPVQETSIVPYTIAVQEINVSMEQTRGIVNEFAGLIETQADQIRDTQQEVSLVNQKLDRILAFLSASTGNVSDQVHVSPTLSVDQQALLRTVMS